jgi:hypothetical protein
MLLFTQKLQMVTQKKYKVTKEKVQMANQTPSFFNSNSEFVNKEELASSGKAFCIIDVEDTDTIYGKKWFLQIFIAGDELLRTLTFAHGDPEKSKREKDFIELSQHSEYLPVHSCYLRKYNFEGKSGYRISARSGGGSCPCTPQESGGDPFLPEWENEEPVVPAPIVEPAPAPAPVVNTLDNQPASPKQYATIGKLGALLNQDPDMPETFGAAAKLIEQLEADYARQTASINKSALKVVAGVPMR